MFGGVADYESWTPRKAKINPLGVDPRNNQTNPSGFEPGSQVLVLCLNGNSQYGVIIGGVPHTNGAKQQEKGVSWVRRFNGVTMQIDDDGQFILSFAGATEANGERRGSADETAAGSTMTFAKDGGIKLETKDGQQSVHLDHANNKIAVRANAELEITGLDPDGSTPKFQLSMKDGELTVKLQDGASLAVVGKDGNAQLTVGDGAKHVAIVEALEGLYNQLKLKLDLFDAHIHPSAMGPTGPPAPMVMAPAWDPTINSTKVSIPNG
jgi:phage baseplate assembly protein gpV